MLLQDLSPNNGVISIFKPSPLLYNAPAMANHTIEGQIDGRLLETCLNVLFLSTTRDSGQKGIVGIP